MTYDMHKLMALIPGDDKTTKGHLYINNPDGTPRWIWPADSEDPDFLMLYNISSFKSKFFMLMVRIIFKLRLQYFAFKKIKILVPASMKS